MGKLLAYPKDFSFYDRTKNQTIPGYDPEWYFTREKYEGGGRSTWDVTSTFPYSAAIHTNLLNGNNEWPKDTAKEQARRLKVDIRTFIDLEIPNTVIRTEQSSSYTFVFPPTKDRKEAVLRDVQHGYNVFNFMTEADAVFFKLRYADYISEPSEFHPDYKPDGESFVAKCEWEARTEIQERWGYNAVPQHHW